MARRIFARRARAVGPGHALRKDGPRNPKSEVLAQRRAAGFVLCGTLVWIHRLGIYFGMAALAYACLFKAAGVFVLVFELWVFVARPLIRKGGRWWSLRERVTDRRRLG